MEARARDEGLAARQPPDAQRGAEVDDWSWRQTRAPDRDARAGSRRRYKRATALALGSLLAATATALAPPYLRQARDRRRHPRAATCTRSTDRRRSSSSPGLAELGHERAQTYFTGWTGERILADLRNTLFRHLQRLSLGFYERNRAGVIISRLTNDVEALDQLVTDGVTTLVQSTLILIGTAVILFFLDWRLALATLAVLPFMFVATAFFRVHSARAYRAVRERLGLVTATLAEDISRHARRPGVPRERANQQNFREVNAHYREANQQTVVLNGLYFPFVDFLSALATAIVLGYGGYLVFGGDMTVGTLLRVRALPVELLRPGPAALAALQHVPRRPWPRSTRSWTCMDEEPEVARRAATPASSTGSTATSASTACASATATGPEVLHGIDLDVPAGTTVALVGHTGAGKSTIAKLLARFYDPRDGRITIDGIDLRDVTQASLRRQLGVVPQEGFLFAGTVRDNIAFGRPDADPADVVAAAKAVGAHEFILRARGRLRHEPAGARDAALARPAPARRVRPRAARRPADPDPRRGDVVRGHRHRAQNRAARSGRCSPDRTAFVIAHRLSTIRDADLIVVLEHGRVVEQGTHDELHGRAAASTRRCTATGPRSRSHAAPARDGATASARAHDRRSRRLARRSTSTLRRSGTGPRAPRWTRTEPSSSGRSATTSSTASGCARSSSTARRLAPPACSTSKAAPRSRSATAFLKEHWGHGYATESARASLDWGFDELALERIVAVALESNVASRRVLEKCGLEEIGVEHVYGLEHVKYEIHR